MIILSGSNCTLGSIIFYVFLRIIVVNNKKKTVVADDNSNNHYILVFMRIIRIRFDLGFCFSDINPFRKYIKIVNTCK